jgi:hypothetical protein
MHTSLLRQWKFAPKSFEDLSGVWWLELPNDAARESRLLTRIGAGELLEKLASEASVAQVRLEPACEALGYIRVNAEVSVTPELFDMFFNGCCGYRAHYYASPLLGRRYNRLCVRRLASIIRDAFSTSELQKTAIVSASLRSKHSKIWVARDEESFNAGVDALRVPRWAMRQGLGRRLPLPSAPQLAVLGTFIDPNSQRIWIDPMKVDRDCVIHERGHA